MLSYCLKCRKNIEGKNPKVARSKNGRIMLLSKWALCDSKKSKNLSRAGVNLTPPLWIFEKCVF